MISLLSTNSILLLSLWHIPITPFHYYPTGKASFLSVKRQYWSRRKKAEGRLLFASHHLFSSLTGTLAFTQFVTNSSLSFERAPAVAAVCIQQTARWKTPSFAEGPVQGKHFAGHGLFPLIVPHRLHSRDAVSLQTPPLLRPTGSGLGNRPQRGQPETLRGKGTNGAPGVRRRPGSCWRSSPFAGSPGAPQVQAPEFPGPRPDAAAGGGSAAPAEGPPRPTQAGGGRQLLPAHRVRRAGAERDPLGVPRLLEPWGPAVAPSSATGRSLRPGGDNGHDDFTLQQCDEQRGTPPTSPRPPGRSRALSPPGSGSRPEAAPARRFRSTPHPPPRSGRRPPAEARAGGRRHRRAPRRPPPRRGPTLGTCESAGGSGAAPLA